MRDDLRLVLAFVIPFLAALATTPAAIRVAESVGLHDHPTGYKGHERATPYLGGAAVLLAFLLGALLLGPDVSRIVAIPVCAFALWVVGTIDDRFTVTPRLRVVAEIAAAAALSASGLGWSVFGSDIADFLLTTLWVVGVVNAFNLMDNMDGAASTIAALSSLGAAVLATVVGDIALAAVAVALCGACLGFLPYNLSSPSRIFLGDGGSMPIGFVVAATTMALPLADDVGWHRLLAAMLLAGLPILDTTLVIVSRRRAGVPIIQGGRDHLTHRLRRRLPSARAVAGALALIQVLLCAAALAVTQLGDLSTAFAWAVVMALAATAVAALERDAWAPVRATASVEPDHPVAERRGTGFERAPEPALERSGRRPEPPAVGWFEIVALGLVALAVGLSPFFYGFYDLSMWGPIALLLLAVLFGLVLARPAALHPTALAALVGLVGLWAWSLLSTSWAESADQAITEANRWMLYAALFAILLLLLRDDRLARALLGMTTAVVAALGVYLIIVMLVGDGPSLFLGARLNEPLGYVNGQGGYLLLGLWPLVALAERARSHAVSGAAVAAATMLVGLVVLTQTRAVIPAVVLSAVALLALVPGRQRRAWVLVFVAAGLAMLLDPLLAVYDESEGVPAAAVLREAAVRIVVVALAVGAVWTIVRGVLAWRGATSERVQRSLRAASIAGLAALAVAAGAVGLAASGNPIRELGDEVESFTELQGDGADRTRFTSLGGNRYDYWRVAVDQFTAEPLRGMGAGNYDRTYFLERRTSEDVRQPHSIELQALAELGLVGALALALFLGAVLWGLGRRAQAARRRPEDIGIVVAGGGIFLMWLVHTSVDWLHLIPGVTGVALCGAAVLLSPWARQRSAGRVGTGRRVVVVTSALLVVFAAVYLGRSTLADRALSQGQAALTSNPQLALSKARDSLELNDEATEAYFLVAAAHARSNRYQAARGALIEATRREPHNFLPWALLGDLAVRRGDLRQARAAYARAHELNPRDSTLERLASNPATAAD